MRQPVEGRMRGYSGRLDAAPGKPAAQWALRVSSGGFHVNGGDPARPATEGYNAVLRRILGTLAEAVDREDGVDDGVPVDRPDGERLVDLRPQAGWGSWRELEETLFPSDPRKFDVLREYLLLHAWVDRKVIRPNAVAGMLYTGPRTWGEIRLAHESHPGDSVPDFERLPVSPGGRIVGRAPVDLPWARTRRPAMIALLSDLRGIFLDEKMSTDPDAPYPDQIGWLTESRLVNLWNPDDACHHVAEAFLTSTTNIQTWDAFNAFCDGIPLEGNADLVQARRDIVKANFNPNSDLNKFGPDASLARLVDKSDLLQYSTEFSLLPLGYGHVSVEGRALDAQGRLLASAVLGADLEGDLALRLTTQREFVAGDLGALDLAGDEGAARSYGNAPYITGSQGNLKAFGHKLFGGSGMSLQSLPEPHTAPPASYDGQVRLSTLETGDDQDGPQMMFLARWDNGFDAEYTGDNGNRRLATPYDDQQPLPGSSLWQERPNTLHTDGVYSERGRQPAYYCMGNMAGQRGTFSFWLKPNFDPVRQDNGPNHRQHLLLDFTRLSGAGGDFAAAAFGITHTRDLMTDSPLGFGFVFERGYGNDWGDPQMSTWIEQVGQTPERRDPPHQWNLVTMRWDVLETDAVDVTELLIDHGQGALDREDDYRYLGTATNDGIDFRMPDGTTQTTDTASLPPATFHLGVRGNASTVPMGATAPPDATFDEFAIYDFGPAASAIPATAALIGNRFRDGRFYKESGYSDLLGGAENTAGRWFSAPIDLGAVRLKRLAWTPILPRGLKAPLPPGGQAGRDGEPGPDGRIVLEMADGTGQDYLKDSGGTPVARLRARADGEWLDRRISSPFRFHAVFQPNLEPDTLNSTPVLDPLALDDITVTYERPGGARILGWEWVSSP
jgi:hypothetical protein